MVIGQSRRIRQQSRYFPCCAEHTVIFNTIAITIATHASTSTTY